MIFNNWIVTSSSSKLLLSFLYKNWCREQWILWYCGGYSDASCVFGDLWATREEAQVMDQPSARGSDVTGTTEDAAPGLRPSCSPCTMVVFSYSTRCPDGFQIKHVRSSTQSWFTGCSDPTRCRGRWLRSTPAYCWDPGPVRTTKTCSVEAFYMNKWYKYLFWVTDAVKNLQHSLVVSFEVHCNLIQGMKAIEF